MDSESPHPSVTGAQELGGGLVSHWHQTEVELCLFQAECREHLHVTTQWLQSCVNFAELNRFLVIMYTHTHTHNQGALKNLGKVSYIFI